MDDFRHECIDLARLRRLTTNDVSQPNEGRNFTPVLVFFEGVSIFGWNFAEGLLWRLARLTINDIDHTLRNLE